MAWFAGLLAPADPAPDADCYGEGWESESAAPAGAEGAGGGDAPDGADGEGGLPTGDGPGAAAPAIAWLHGGFDGSRAAEVAEARIADLRMDGNGLSFRWESGGCEALGASSRTDYSRTLACAFYWDEAGRRWIGGKFDWISTSRTSRSFENVRAGYHGWDPEAFFGARRRAFCVASADGKWRSNLLEETK